MFVVTGRVLVRESGLGVPNISVVLYDLDPQAPRPWTAALHSMVQEPSPRLALRGERIGSTITNAVGAFAFKFDASDFCAGDPNHKPDLVLLLLSPEDAAVDQGGFAVARPDSERLLYATPAPIMNAGRQEAFLIRLPEQLLARHGLTHATASGRLDRRITATKAAITGGQTLSLALDQLSADQLKVRFAPALTRRAQTSQAFAEFSLSRFSKAARQGTTYVSSKQELPQKLNQVVDQRLAEIPRTLDAGVQRKLQISLTSAELSEWGVMPDPATGTFETEVPVGRIVAKVRRAIGGGPLERARSWLEIGCDLAHADRRFEDTVARCAPAAPGSDDTQNGQTSAAPLTNGRIAELLGEQMAHVTPPEIELQYGVERNGKLTATITRPGPADVTAFHDFHELQIAFEHVWSEALDKRIPALFQDAYAEMVKYKHRVSGESTLPAVTNVDDMQSLYDEYLALRELVESEVEPPPPISAALPVPPEIKALLPSITREEWGHASDEEKAELQQLAAAYADATNYDAGDFLADVHTLGGAALLRKDAADNAQARAEEILAAIREDLESTRERQRSRASGGRRRSTLPNSRLQELFEELDERLAEPYRFDIFAPDSVNYGVMLTYRQKWVPLEYQVGSLVSTLPLAPKEVRKYSTKRVVKRTRTEKELEDREQSSRRESNDTSRADAEIVRQAREKTAFEQTANGTISVGVFSGQFGTRFGVDAEKSSAQTKKNFREAVLKAADEFKQKHSLQVETSLSVETESIHSGEVSNPNDEISVTYLFYELQRQYEISERLHRVTPVVLVANDVPLPHEVDEDWLMAHHWILQRVILDDSLRGPLHLLTTGLAGNELALEALRDAVERQVNLVQELTRQLQTKTDLAEKAFEELKRLVKKATTADDAAKLKDIAMAIAFGPFSLAGGGGDDQAAEKREEIAKLALERADKEAQHVSARLTSEVTALGQAIDKYTQALREHFDRETAIAMLRIHVKQNILYYMQAIWDHEPPDQRYFRLYNIEVPWIETVETTTGVPARGRRLGSGEFTDYLIDTTIPLELLGEITATFYVKRTRKLSEIADLDNLLGYKGNYMIFPARVPSHLHLYMMQDYIDPETGGLRDPDGFADYTSRELLDYVCCLRRAAPERLAEKRDELLQLLKERLASPRRESELVVVPTDSLFIEALPGSHPVMEDFKLVHRAVDVKKVQAEVRRAEIENLRLAARLLEGETDDPDIERKTVIEGNPSSLVVPTEG